MRHLLLLCLLTLSAACQRGPCEGVSGACVALTLSWEGPGAPEVDRIVVTLLDQRHESAAAARPLPLSLLVILPAPGPGARIDEDRYPLQVTASRSGQVIGTGQGEVELSPGAHVALTLALTPGGATAQDGGSDGPADGSPEDGGAPLSFRQVARASQPLWGVVLGGTATAFEGYAVGERGAVLRGTGNLTSGGTWRTETAGAGTLRAVSLLGGQAVAVGDVGLYTRRVGVATWDADASLPSGAPLRALFGAALDDLYAVGDGGRAVHRQGVWGNEGLPPGTGGLRGVWGSGPGDVYIVGDGGVVLRRFGGGAWVREAQGLTGADLLAVFGEAAGEPIAVGKGGVILQRRGGAWGRAPEAAPVDLVAGCAADGQAFALGDGVVMRRRGGTWRSEPGPAQPRAVSCLPGSGPQLAAVLGGGEVLLGH